MLMQPDNHGSKPVLPLIAFTLQTQCQMLLVSCFRPHELKTEEATPGKAQITRPHLTLQATSRGE